MNDWEKDPTGEVMDPCPGCGQLAAYCSNTEHPPTFPKLPLACVRTRNGWWWFCSSFKVTRIEHEKMAT